MKTKLAFIGLGTMGFPMAGHLADKGYPLSVYNRTTSVAEKWLESMGTTPALSIALTPAEAAKNTDVIFTCVGNDNDVREVYFGDNGIFKTIRPGSTLIDHTTTSAILAKELATQAKTRHCHFLDAPVSGGQVGAENACLTIMVGGDPKVFSAHEEILQSYAKAIKHVGSSGYGQLCKMVNQICVAGVLQGLSEGLWLAKQSGFEASTILDTLQHGAAGSWQMTNRTENMMADQFDCGFAVDWMRKDLQICLDEASRLGIELPMTKQIDNYYQQLQQRGYSRSDTSVLIKQFDEDIAADPQPEKSAK
jgi:3-hydroxyisobutyrate dehydrogenase